MSDAVRPASPSTLEVTAVLAGCGITGFFLGMVWRPSWQDALEPAQVLAGLVRYPPHNPVYLYATRTWTVLHQAPALLLWAGLSERALTLILSGLMGMVSLQALGVTVLALSRDVPLAILAPVFILVTNTASGGVTYPVHLLGVPFTYGVVGLSWVLLCVGLMAAGRGRSGALLLGFSPAIHATIGALAITAVAIGVAVTPHARRPLSGAWRYFLAGAAAALLSAAVHFAFTAPGAWAGVSIFAQHWDEHRQPFPLLSPRALGTWFSVAMPALWWSRFRRDLPTHAHVLAGSLAAAGALGAALSVSYWLVPAAVPHVIPSLMPSRLLNLSVLACMAFIVGLSAQYRVSASVQRSVLVTVLVLAAAACLVPPDDPRPAMAIGWLAMGMTGLALMFAAERRRRGTAAVTGSPPQPAWVRRITIGTMAAALGVVVLLACLRFEDTARRDLADRTSDPLFAAAAARPGLLLTADSQHQIQLLTRRPVLLDGGALDALLYVPDAAPETDRILRRIYGTNMEAIRHATIGHLEADTAMDLWEARTLDEWRDIAGEFSVTDVITGPDWTLQLPVVASNGSYILYAIPARR